MAFSAGAGRAPRLIPMRSDGLEPSRNEVHVGGEQRNRKRASPEDREITRYPSMDAASKSAGRKTAVVGGPWIMKSTERGGFCWVGVSALWARRSRPVRSLISEERFSVCSTPGTTDHWRPIASGQDVTRLCKRRLACSPIAKKQRCDDRTGTQSVASRLRAKISSSGSRTVNLKPECLKTTVGR